MSYVNIVLKNGGVESIPVGAFATVTVTDSTSSGVEIVSHVYSLDGVEDLIISHGSEQRVAVAVAEPIQPEPSEPVEEPAVEDDPDASEPAEAKAAELGVDLATVTGTGKDGMITVADVKDAAQSVPE